MRMPQSQQGHLRSRHRHQASHATEAGGGRMSSLCPVCRARTNSKEKNYRKYIEAGGGRVSSQRRARTKNSQRENITILNFEFGIAGSGKNDHDSAAASARRRARVSSPRRPAAAAAPAPPRARRSPRGCPPPPAERRRTHAAAVLPRAGCPRHAQAARGGRSRADSNAPAARDRAGRGAMSECAAAGPLRRDSRARRAQGRAAVDSLGGWTAGPAGLHAADSWLATFTGSRYRKARAFPFTASR